MKRFTDAEKFQKGFYRALPAAYKLLWDYICCECSTSGIWYIEEDVAHIRIGKDVEFDLDTALKLFNADETRVVVVNGGKEWFIMDFIGFQYGKMTTSHKLYKKILQELQSIGLEDFIKIESEKSNTVTIALSKGYESPIIGIKDKDIDKDKDKEEKKTNKKEIAEKMIGLYTEHCPSLPKPILTDKKVTCTHARLEEFSKPNVIERAKLIDQSIEDAWGVAVLILKLAEKSDFLSGRKSDFICDYSWIFCCKNNWVKILEQRYDHEKNDSMAVGQVFKTGSNNNNYLF